MKTKGAVAQGELTCTALAEDRLLWKQIVNNKYGVQRNSQSGTGTGRRKKRKGLQQQAEEQEERARTGRADGTVHYRRIHQNLPCPHQEEQRMIYAVYGHNTTTNRMLVCPHLWHSWTEAVKCALVIKEKIKDPKPTIVKGRSANIGGDRDRLNFLISTKITQAAQLEQQHHESQHHESDESKEETKE